MARPLPTPTLAALSAALLLGACSTYGPPRLPPGATVEQATAAMGAPTGDYRMPGDVRRLEFARGPMGPHTWMLDFDAGGRLLRAEQVLTVAHFEEITPGMPADAVRRLLGRPSETGRIGFQDRTLWSYRFEDPFCRWFQVDLDAAQRVVGGGYAPDPACAETRPDPAP